MPLSNELSFEGYNFLSTLFKKYDVDKDDTLSPIEITDLFSTCPVPPWGPNLYNAVQLSARGWIDLRGFHALWTLMTLLDVRKTLEHLAYLGYSYYDENVNGTSQLNALGLVKQTAKNVYRCKVIGSKGAGKSTFCQAILGRSLEEVKKLPSENIPRYSISLIPIYGEEKYFAMEDIDVRDSFNYVLTASEIECDVCCLVYDISDSHSFEFVARIFLKNFLDDRVPVLILANKSDLSPVRQDYILQPESFCAKHKLPAPQTFSARKGYVKESDVFVKLATMSAFPHLRQLGFVNRDTNVITVVGVGLAVIAMAGIFIVRMFRTQ